LGTKIPSLITRSTPAFRAGAEGLPKPVSPTFPVPTRSAPLTARRTAYRPGLLVLTFTGEIDALTLPILDRELRTAPPGTTVVDLTQVAFLGLAGARALAAAAERAGTEGRRFGVVANSRTLARLFRITGLAAVVPMFASLSDALRELLAAGLRETAC
jgi:anti-anti-sigma factor